MPDANIYVDRILVISQTLEDFIADNGADPCPFLNTWFTELTSLVRDEQANAVADEILQRLQADYPDRLAKLHSLCAMGEAALEEKAVAHFCASSTEPTEQNKIQALENILAPVYPYRWSATQANLQKELLFGTSDLQDQLLIVYGFTGLALTHLSWIWTAEMHSAKFNILALDPSATHAATGQNFLNSLKEKGCITSGQIKIVDVSEGVDPSDYIARYNIKTAILAGLESSAAKAQAFKSLQNSGVEKICMTYPEKLTQLLYPAFDIWSALSPVWIAESCLFAAPSGAPSCTVDKVIYPDADESLWLSSYVFTKGG